MCSREKPRRDLPLTECRGRMVSHSAEAGTRAMTLPGARPAPLHSQMPAPGHLMASDGIWQVDPTQGMCAKRSFWFVFCRYMLSLFQLGAFEWSGLGAR